MIPGRMMHYISQVVRWVKQALNFAGRGRFLIILKTPEEIEIMREAGRYAGRLLRELGSLIEPGLDIRELDAYADEYLRRHGLGEVFKGYKPGFSDRPFPGHICISMNHEVVHGLPNRPIRLKEGDIISIDVGVRYRGYVGDTARTFPVGEVSEARKRLIAVAQEALRRGIQAARAGNRLGDIGHAIQHYVEVEEGLQVVRKYVGHGVGRSMHEDPSVPNYGEPGKGLLLRPGLVIAIEPMVVLGSARTKVLDDGWTVVTVDGSDAAHFEHTVAILEDRTIILTDPD